MNPNIIALAYPSSLADQFRLHSAPPGFTDVSGLQWNNPGAVVMDMYNPPERNLVSTCTRITVWGTGTNPFGANNCE